MVQPLPKVIVYRRELLPRTNTFVMNQALAMKRWQPILVGELHASDSLSVTEVEVRLLRDPAHRLSDFAFRACRLLHIPHPSTVRSLRALGARLVHAHFGLDAVDIWPHVRRLGVPMLATLHGYDINIDRVWWEAGNAGPRRRYYPRQLLALARQPQVRFLAVSESIRSQAIAYGIPSERISVHYTGIDTDEFRPGNTPLSARPRRILYVGRLVENKGVEILIRAVARVARSLPGVELTVVGDGPLRPRLEAVAIEVGVSTRFLGTLDSRGVKAQIDQSRVLCQPSVTIDNGESEGLGMAILEAQACGVPVITSARGGAIEGILDGITGFRFPEQDEVGLANALMCLLQDDALSEAMSAEAVRFIGARFDLRVRTTELETLYDRLAFGDST